MFITGCAIVVAITTVVYYVTQFGYLEKTAVADDLLGIDDVDERLLDGHVLDTGHVESVHAVPPCAGANTQQDEIAIHI